jgi:tetratricopeptide (TPR) repeat protein
MGEKGTSGEYFQKAAACLSRNDPASAEPLLREAIRRAPGRAAPYMVLTKICLGQKRYYEVLRLYNDLLAGPSPDSVSEHVMRINLMQVLDRYDGLDRLLDGASLKILGNDLVLEKYANICWRAGKMDRIERLISALAKEKPAAKRYLVMVAKDAKMHGRYGKALTLWEEYLRHYPGDVSAYPEYIAIFNALGRQDKDTPVSLLGQCLEMNSDSSQACRILGDFLYNSMADIGQSKAILERGLSMDPNATAIIELLLQIAIYNNDQRTARGLRTRLEQLGHNGTMPVSLKPLCFVNEVEKGLSSLGLESLLDIFNAPPPVVVDAERYSFERERQTDNPVIALFAYAHPRSNLDVMHYFYRLLKKAGRTVCLFLDNRGLYGNNVLHFDFSEIEIQDDDVFIGAWPEFFYGADFIDCILTNDMSGINASKLPGKCRLVIQAPHNTKSVSIKGHAHYYTLIKGAHVTADMLEAPNLPNKFCIIGNHYTKDEVLYDYCKSVGGGHNVISYCPTSLAAIDLNPDDNGYDLKVKLFGNLMSEMIAGILEGFPMYALVYRPFLGHQIHWEVSSRILNLFAGHDRFIFDNKSNSKHTLALSDFLITDTSSIGITFSRLKQKPYIAFLPKPFFDCDTSNGNGFIRCESTDAVLAALGAQHEQFAATATDGASVGPKPTEFTGVSYLVENLDYVLSGAVHPEWRYHRKS